MGRFIGQAASVRFRLACAGLHRNRSQSLLPSPLGRAESPAPLRQALGVQARRHRARNPAQVECREGACSHLCRGAARVALATPPWQQRRHRQNEPREQREQRRACSRYAESRPRKTESTSATPQVVQPKVLRFGDED